MSKTTGKLKYDLALSTTTIYDASSIFVNKSAELSINGNANLNYKTIGPTYDDNGSLIPAITIAPGPSVSSGSGYLYIRNLGGSTAPSIRIAAGGTGVAIVEKSTPDGTPQDYDSNQIMDIHPQEFAFFPMAIGPLVKTYSLRAGFIAGSTYWTGPTSLQIEYAYFGTDENTGPLF